MDTQRVGNQSWRFHVGINASGNQLGARWHRGGRIDGELRDGCSDAVGWIERSVLIGAIAERVLQIFVHPETSATDGFGTKRTPRHAHARLRQERSVVVLEDRIAYVGSPVDYAIGEKVVGGAAVRLVPAGGGFGTKANGEGEAGAEANRVLGIPGAEEGAPVQLGRRRIKEETGNGALQKRLDACERCLAELAEGEGFVGLEGLEPQAEIELVTAFDERDAVLNGVEIARDGEIAAIVAASKADLRCWIGGRAAADDHRPDRAAE